jgi:hypothetical protein
MRGAQHFALSVAVSALAAAGLSVSVTTSALAEFEIQESEVEKGGIELEYRGAVHSGFTRAAREEAEDDNEGGALDEEEEEEFLRQSHDLEIEYGVTDRFLVTATLSADEPLDQDFDVSSVELEMQYELIEREGNGLGFAFLGAYGIATRGGETDEIEFGPIIELASGKALLTLNPFLTSQIGDNRETDGLGFDYGWRGQYAFAKKWGIGVEMFGEIEDLSNAGSFDDQTHSIGPTLFYNPNGDDDDDDDNGGDDLDDKSLGVPDGPEMEVSFNVGVQFGLTDNTSDTALKFQGSLEF